MDTIEYKEPLFNLGKPLNEEKIKHIVALQNEMNIINHHIYMILVNKFDKEIMNGGEKIDYKVK